MTESEQKKLVSLWLNIAGLPPKEDTKEPSNVVPIRKDK